MEITSSAFAPGRPIPAQYTCDGEEYNPPLAFTNAPKEAESLVLIMDDPDVPPSVRKDQMWIHWVIFNMPPNTTSIAENSAPKGTIGSGTSRLGYQGPCPPPRKEHRYFFKLFALDTRLSLKEGSSKEEVEKAMAGHILAQAELIGTYNRK